MIRCAAIDLGTNSTRLLVADVEIPEGGTAADARVVTIERLMRITRLGEGVDANRRLAPQAIERVAVVLREYREVIERLGATKVRATATSAARDAQNRDEFVEAVRDALGVAPDIIPGVEEAALSFLGATAGLDAPAPFLVVDQQAGRVGAQINGGTADHAVSSASSASSACSVQCPTASSAPASRLA